MIKSIILITTLVVVLMGCKPNNGKYLVYKTHSDGSISSHLDDEVTSKYANSQYQLSFADKYVNITKVGTNNSIVLADEGEVVPGRHNYELKQYEGADSVWVEYELNITSQDMILTVGASRKSHIPSLGNEASVDFYLSKTTDQ
jgi:hypothetical protein